MRKFGAALVFLSLLGVSSFVLAAGPEAAKAGGNHARPFWGNVVGTVHWEDHGFDACPPQGGFLTVSGAEGQMNHLGRTTFGEVHCAGSDGDGLPLNGLATFTAANGDKLLASYVFGSAYWNESPDPSVFVEEADYTITGGTGRFEDASGSFHLTIFVMPTGDPTLPGASWPVEFVVAGVIRY